jgi:hypothetical protein
LSSFKEESKSLVCKIKIKIKNKKIKENIGNRSLERGI